MKQICTSKDATWYELEERIEASWDQHWAFDISRDASDWRARVFSLHEDERPILTVKVDKNGPSEVRTRSGQRATDALLTHLDKLSSVIGSKITLGHAHCYGGEFVEAAASLKLLFDKTISARERYVHSDQPCSNGKSLLQNVRLVRNSPPKPITQIEKALVHAAQIIDDDLASAGKANLESRNSIGVTADAYIRHFLYADSGSAPASPPLSPFQRDHEILAEYFKDKVVVGITKLSRTERLPDGRRVRNVTADLFVMQIADEAEREAIGHKGILKTCGAAYFAWTRPGKFDLSAVPRTLARHKWDFRPADEIKAFAEHQRGIPARQPASGPSASIEPG